MSQNDPATVVMTDRAADPAAVLSAATRVPANAPASLWSDVANDASFPVAHRSVAAWQLLKRHVRPGMPLRDAAALLAGARWLDGADLEKIESLGGELPVVIPEHGAAFMLRLPHGTPGELPDLGAYLAIDQDTDAGTLRAALQSHAAGAALGNARLSGIALFPDHLGPATP
jgi:hypothetical protein